MMSATLMGIRTKFWDVKQLTTEKFAALLADPDVKVLTLDCREKQEFDVSRIPEAKWLDPKLEQEGIEKEIREAIGSGVTDIVCYCSIGYRSCQVARKLYIAHSKTITNGHKLNIYNLEGSIFKWANEDRPRVDGKGQETKLVHPYNSVWGKMLNADLHYNSGASST